MSRRHISGGALDVCRSLRKHSNPLSHVAHRHEPDRERQRHIPCGPTEADPQEKPTPHETDERAPGEVARDSALRDEVLASDFVLFGRDPERLALEPTEPGFRRRRRLAGGTCRGAMNIRALPDRQIEVLRGDPIALRANRHRLQDVSQLPHVAVPWLPLQQPGTSE